MLSDTRVAAMVAVKDLEKAKPFYTDTLGLKILREEPEGVEFECGGGSILVVYPSSFAGTAQNTVAGWETANIDAEIADLRGRGVTFEEYDMPGLKTENGIAKLGTVRGAWFKDPDGNIFAITERQ